MTVDTPRSGSPAPSWTGEKPREPPSGALKALEERYPGKVPVTLSGGHAYVWRVSDASRLRVEHHICGLLIGTLPLVPQQNVFLGLPLQLIPEEVVYLLRAHAIVLIDDTASFDDPKQSAIDLYIASLNADVASQQAEQVAASQHSKGTAIQKLLEQGNPAPDQLSVGANASEAASLQKAIAKRKAREEKRRQQAEAEAAAAAATAAAAAQAEGTEGGKGQSTPKGTPTEEQAPSFPPPASQIEARPRTSETVERDEWGQLSFPSTYQYVTPASALEPPLPMEWYNPVSAPDDGQERQTKPTGTRSYTTLSSAQQAGVWTYPSNADERARCAVFESLHDLGYYMSIGLRFGGDFNVYPGDPLRYHSHFTATVKASPTSSMSAMELISNGRLGTAVKKAHLVAGCEGVRTEAGPVEREDTIEHSFGSVTYFSLTWAGFGT